MWGQTRQKGTECTQWSCKAKQGIRKHTWLPMVIQGQARDTKTHIAPSDHARPSRDTKKTHIAHARPGGGRRRGRSWNCGPTSAVSAAYVAWSHPSPYWPFFSYWNALKCVRDLSDDTSARNQNKLLLDVKTQSIALCFMRKAGKTRKEINRRGDEDEVMEAFWKAASED